MRKSVGFYKRFKIELALAMMILAMLGVSISASSLYAEEWGPYLGPVFPTDVDEEEMIDEDYAPDSMVRSSGKSKSRQLPLPAKKRSIRTVSQHADFDDMLNSGTTIIPQQLLNEEPVSETHPVVPKTRTKKSPLPDESPAFAPFVTNNNETLNEGEWIVNDSDIQNWTALPNTYGGVYNSYAPALESGYAGMMMVKPFGTGLLDNVTFFGGTTGFKSEPNADSSGNFGFTEGINWSGPVTPLQTISGQAGFRAVQSNINGNSNTNRNGRNQYFVTAGLFKRDLSFPIQGGVVLDWYRDDFYGKVQSQQIRYEISARTFSNTEYGLLGGFGVSEKGNSYLDVWQNAAAGTSYSFALRSQQYYLLFIRKHFSSGGLGEFRCGLTDNGDTILAGLGEFPLSDRFSLNGSFSAMIPESGHGHGGWQRENWEISVGIIFYFRGGACSKPANAHRPMFDVGGNGSFFNRIVRK
ncbi:MAG: hypothetical protein LBG58_06775 [Planctomycetaceae bacterium]|jgi:hypothetical protein|nr:hypothetical protein [Planctomycetaceae bacterium]